MNIAFNNISISDLIDATSLIFAAVGGCFVYMQWKRSIKFRRAEFISQLLEHIRFNNEIAKAIYIVDYNPNWYNKDFHCGELEPYIDKLFSNVDYICYLYSAGNISKKEFCTFKYDLNRICISHSSQGYLWNLFNFASKNKAVCPYQNLIDYGCKNKLFPKDFKTNKKLYEKHLNF